MYTTWAARRCGGMLPIAGAPAWQGKAPNLARGEALFLAGVASQHGSSFHGPFCLVQAEGSPPRSQGTPKGSVGLSAGCWWWHTQQNGGEQ